MNSQFYRGIVTDSGGDELTNEAFLTFGSADGQQLGDCEVRIFGERAREAAHLIEAAPDLLNALRRLLSKFENCARSAGNSDEVIADATEFARGAIAKSRHPRFTRP